ncbi:HAD family phosphatase [Streptomonospora sp. S1-112]|uniref:HAD family phosphatase n=1 Tax=Streptomonospora mangrovi TaxID=2883123 RepID=A0A9X3NQF7_9ACTN|nr:HAD family phosphatase [Streptomonospora mangrovi]MDA0567265.1 HAD family phosphatase [Streptomonospora mangrovi]
MSHQNDTLPRAALFDLDGTLINSEPRSMEVWSRLLDLHNIPHDEATLHRFMGRRGTDVLEEDPSLFPGVTWDVLLAELQVIQSAPDLPETRELPESAAFVRRLHAEGVPFALVTSAGPQWAEIALERLGVRSMFKGLITAADVTEGKPHPQGYLAGADLLGYAPEHIVVFEDTPAGIEAGRRAGMRVVAITTTHDPAVLSGADLIVDHLTEVDWPRLARVDRPGTPA